MEQAQKDALKVVALRNRIAEITAGYEDQLADLRAEATIVIQGLNDQVAELSVRLEAKDEDVAVQEDTAAEAV